MTNKKEDEKDSRWLKLADGILGKDKDKRWVRLIGILLVCIFGYWLIFCSSFGYTSERGFYFESKRTDINDLKKK